MFHPIQEAAAPESFNIVLMFFAALVLAFALYFYVPVETWLLAAVPVLSCR